MTGRTIKATHASRSRWWWAEGGHRGTMLFIHAAACAPRQKHCLVIKHSESKAHAPRCRTRSEAVARLGTAGSRVMPRWCRTPHVFMCIRKLKRRADSLWDGLQGLWRLWLCGTDRFHLTVSTASQFAAFCKLLLTQNRVFSFFSPNADYCTVKSVVL